MQASLDMHLSIYKLHTSTPRGDARSRSLQTDNEYTKEWGAPSTWKYFKGHVVGHKMHRYVKKKALRGLAPASAQNQSGAVHEPTKKNELHKMMHIPSSNMNMSL